MTWGSSEEIAKARRQVEVTRLGAGPTGIECLRDALSGALDALEEARGIVDHDAENARDFASLEAQLSDVRKELENVKENRVVEVTGWIQEAAALSKENEELRRAAAGDAGEIDGLRATDGHWSSLADEKEGELATLEKLLRALVIDAKRVLDVYPREARGTYFEALLRSVCAAENYPDENEAAGCMPCVECGSPRGVGLKCNFLHASTKPSETGPTKPSETEPGVGP